ncbi:hypothetical protein D3C78_1776080 [compost metagenome]
MIPVTERTSAPAPVESTNGTVPAIKAIDVITIGRNRSRHAFNADSTMPRPSISSSRANSTIRMAFLHASPTSTTSPT